MFWLSSWSINEQAYTDEQYVFIRIIAPETTSICKEVDAATGAGAEEVTAILAGDEGASSDVSGWTSAAVAATDFRIEYADGETTCRGKWNPSEGCFVGTVHQTVNTVIYQNGGSRLLSMQHCIKNVSEFLIRK